VGDVTGGLEHANGGAALEASLGRGEDIGGNLRGLNKTVMMLRVGLCPYPSAGVSGKSEMF
jgi:hypothetical protein